jgi:hypothetical protein
MKKLLNCIKKFGDKGRFTNFAPPKAQGVFIFNANGKCSL